MDLNKFLPNKTLLWKDARNAWGMIIAFSVYLTVTTSVNLIYSINNIISHPQIFQGALVTFPQTYGVNAFIITIFTVALAGSLIGAERDQNTFNLLLAMPYHRQQILNSKYTLGFIFIFTVFAVNALIMTTALGINSGVAFDFTVADIWLWALRHILVLCFIYTFTMVIATISGNTIGNMILSLIFLFFPLGFLSLGAMNMDFWGIGFGLSHIYSGNPGGLINNIGILLTVPVYIIDNYNQNFWVRHGHPLLYASLIAATAGFYALSHYLFKHNQMESNGEVLMFPKLEPFFKAGVTICFAMVGGPFFAYYFDVGPADGFAAAGITALLYLAVGTGVWLAVQKTINWRKAS